VVRDIVRNMALRDITRLEVDEAVAECDRLGRAQFLRDNGFRRAQRYLLSYGGRLYDSKAIVGVAHGYLPGRERLTAKEFVGGDATVAALLRRLDYTVVSGGPADSDGAEELLARIAGLTVNRASGRGPALDQPITLLWAIGRARRGAQRLLPWDATQDAVGGLLVRHGQRNERPRPDYPVAALHRAGLWELRDHEGAVPSAHGDAELPRWFAANQPTGGLAEPCHDLLRRSGETRLAVLCALLETYFDGLDHRELLTEVGLYDEGVADDAPPAAGPGDEAGSGGAADQPAGAAPVPADPAALSAAAEEAAAMRARAAEYDRLCRMAERRERERRQAGEAPRRDATGSDPIRLAAARKAVLKRSDGYCENPTCTGQPADVTTAGAAILEVDHVVELGLGGRDHPSQMIALCPNCHAIKTRGRTRDALRSVLLELARERHVRLRSGNVN
jgi:5-methylcytosine-specific restriction protein A